MELQTVALFDMEEKLYLKDLIICIAWYILKTNLFSVSNSESIVLSSIFIIISFTKNFFLSYHNNLVMHVYRIIMQNTRYAGMYCRRKAKRTELNSTIIKQFINYLYCFGTPWLIYSNESDFWYLLVYITKLQEIERNK